MENKNIINYTERERERKRTAASALPSALIEWIVIHIFYTRTDTNTQPKPQPHTTLYKAFRNYIHTLL